ncbi:MAG: DctP family TRAP transporter solute-binding subunit [Ruminococcaceae bacterium]|nr:DctP family TRAP transporter solute-binding subunit [Oscillospiraceae bacterium]
MKLKAFLSSVLAISLTAGLLSACGSKPASSASSSQQQPSSASQSAAEGAEPVLLQIAYENNPGEPIDLACNEWKKLLEEKSGGSMKVELFPSSQLGSKTDLIDQVLAGAPVCTIADGAFYAERGVPDFGIVFGPYLFDSWDECWKLTKSDWYQEQSKKLEDAGLKILASNWVYGERHTLTKKPVHTPDDLKGMKIRVANSIIFIKGFDVLGATPTPMALGDVYTALQQGTIDGLENPLPVLYNGKFQEVAKYLVLDGHVKNFTTWTVGTDFFNSLTPEQQKLLVETAEEAGVKNNDFQAAAEQEVREKLIADGVTIYEPTAEEKELFRQAALKFYEDPEICGAWTDGLYDTVNAILKA